MIGNLNLIGGYKKGIRKCGQLIGKLQFSICHKDKIKFGIDITGTVKEAISLDEANGKYLWKYAIKF